MKRAATADYDYDDENLLTARRELFGEKGAYSPRFSPTSPSKRQRGQAGDMGSLLLDSPRAGLKFSHYESIGTGAGAASPYDDDLSDEALAANLTWPPLSAAASALTWAQEPNWPAEQAARLPAAPPAPATPPATTAPARNTHLIRNRRRDGHEKF